MSSSRSQNFVEYKLKASCLSSYSHHLMTLSTNSNSIASFAPPVRMYRDESIKSPMAVDGRSPPVEGDEQQSGGRLGFQSKRRSKVLSQEIEHTKKQTALLGPDVHPWVLEDGDGEHALVGKREAGQQSHYVFFVNQGNSFLIVPLTHWYRFAPKSNAPQLTLEEVEALMAGPKQRKKAPSAKKSPNAAGDEEEQEGNASILDQIKKGIQEDNPPQGSLPAMRAMIQEAARQTPSAADSPFRHAEELDYEEVFEDDEEGGFDETAYGESDDPSAPVPVRANRAAASRLGSLSLAGKDLRRIVQSHDKGVVEADSEDDDDLPPTPVPFVPKPAAAPVSNNAPKPAPPVYAAAAPVVNIAPVLKAKRPHSSHSPSPSSSPSPSPPLPAAAAANVPKLTEQAIIGVLRRGPIRTKDLIYQFRHEFKDPENKLLFRDVVKRVAAVGSSSEDGEKTLVIKPEFLN